MPFVIADFIWKSTCPLAQRKKKKQKSKYQSKSDSEHVYNVLDWTTMKNSNCVIQTNTLTLKYTLIVKILSAERQTCYQKRNQFRLCAKQTVLAT